MKPKINTEGKRVYMFYYDAIYITANNQIGNCVMKRLYPYNVCFSKQIRKPELVMN